MQSTTELCSNNAPLKSLDVWVTVIDINVTKTLHVSPSDNVGSVMEHLVASIDIKNDWSKHRLWYPEKKKWLMKLRATLCKYNITFDCQLQFINTLYDICILLPDLQFYSTTVDLTKTVFALTGVLCDEIGIQHSEELSLLTGTEEQSALVSKASTISKQSSENAATMESRKGFSETVIPSGRGFSRPNDMSMSRSSVRTTSLYDDQTHARSPSSHASNASPDLSSIGSHLLLTCAESQFSNSPHISRDEAVKSGLFVIPKSIDDLALINSRWLDDSLSLIEQELFVPGTNILVLSYKFYNFFELNAATEPVRLNQIYNFAKWSILSDHVFCTLNDAISLAAVQLLIHILCTNSSQICSTNISAGSVMPHQSTTPTTKGGEACDEIDDLLNQLQVNEQDSVYTPKLQANLKVQVKKASKTKKMKWVVLRDARLSFFQSEDYATHGSPQTELSLVGSFFSQRTDWKKHKFDVLLHVASSDDIVEEIRLRFNNSSEFADWVTALQLAAENRTLASCEMFTEQSKRHHEQLQVQQSARDAVKTKVCELPPGFSIADCMPSYIIRKNKTKVLTASILEAKDKLGCLSLGEAKLQYIKYCQLLTDWGVSYVVIKQKDAKNEELLGIRASGIFLANRETKEKLKLWKYSDIQKFTPNKDSGCITVVVKEKEFEFFPVGVGWKTVCELIGGNIFMNLRVSHKQLDLTMYFNLTAASDH